MAKDTAAAKDISAETATGTATAATGTGSAAPATTAAATAAGTTAEAPKKSYADMTPEEYQAALERESSGMTDLTRPEIDGYFNAELSKETRGVVKGRAIGFTAFNTPNGIREMVIVNLQSKDPAYAGLMAVKKGKEKVQLKPGQNIGIGITSDLKDLPYYVEHRCGVMLTALEKKQIGGGKTVWKHFFRTSGSRGQKPDAVLEALENAQATDMSDIPF